MTVYRLVVEVPDPEVEDAPRLPLWSQSDLDAVLGSFHEWMRYSLSDEQRRGLRWTLEVVASD